MKIRRLMGIILALFLCGCASTVTTVILPLSSGQMLHVQRVGDDVVDAEDDHFVVVESGLTSYRKGGRNYVRWQFILRLKQFVVLRSIRIDELTAPVPMQILIDTKPHVEDDEWTGLSPLIEARASIIPWLFDSTETWRVFRFRIEDINGKVSILNQPVLFNQKTKHGIRYLLGPETNQ